MHKSTKLISCIALAFTVSACGSVKHKQSITENLRFAPAIDVPYHEVKENIKENLGLHVRWGGQVISANTLNEVTELTVFSYPLSRDGQPIPRSNNDFVNGRFIVKTSNDTQTSVPRFITVYGLVSGEKTLVNGPKAMTIPVVTAINSKEWRHDPTVDKRGNAYYSLGFSTGHFNLFNDFGHRSFWRNGYGYGYNSHGYRLRKHLKNRSSFYVYKQN